MLTKIIDEYGIVCKINVTNLETSIKWYGENLGLINDERYYAPDNWAQLNCPGIKNFALGLSAHDKPIGPNGQTVTFLVPDIATSKAVLMQKGIHVGDIVDAGKGVLLVTFSDPDGNDLVLRQNSGKIGDH